ncbi:hypothetical protein ACN47A_40845 [Myxococcus fulvus]|uniref:hypothetical protein n=1 Tax=Myxococcus fulvus TaxID=33 RepID=UPI003B99CAEB
MNSFWMTPRGTRARVNMGGGMGTPAAAHSWMFSSPSFVVAENGVMPWAPSLRATCAPPPHV